MSAESTLSETITAEVYGAMTAQPYASDRNILAVIGRGIAAIKERLDSYVHQIGLDAVVLACEVAYDRLTAGNSPYLPDIAEATIEAYGRTFIRPLVEALHKAMHVEA